MGALHFQQKPWLPSSMFTTRWWTRKDSIEWIFTAAFDKFVVTTQGCDGLLYRSYCSRETWPVRPEICWLMASISAWRAVLICVYRRDRMTETMAINTMSGVTVDKPTLVSARFRSVRQMGACRQHNRGVPKDTKRALSAVIIVTRRGSLWGNTLVWKWTIGANVWSQAHEMLVVAIKIASQIEEICTSILNCV